MSAYDDILDLKQRVVQSIVGQESVIEQLIIALLCNGNVLMEGLPGLAKTRAIKTLSNQLASEFQRIQFTPDLLPSDVTGSEVYYTESGRGEFRFQKGPIFGNLILADEINRAPAKVQAALLEAMEERQVTVAGKTHRLPDLFMVLATQNPIEQEGTYPLPEAQMDRFLIHVTIGYPDDTAEREIIRLVREEAKTGAAAESTEQLPQQVVFDARSQIENVEVSDAAESYIVSLIAATRYPEKYGEDLKRWILVGASPRGSIALDKVSRTHAWLRGRDFVTPEDIQAVVHGCLRHRIVLSYEANAEGVTADQVIDEIVKSVAAA